MLNEAGGVPLPVTAVHDLPQVIVAEARTAPLCRRRRDRPEGARLHRLLEPKHRQGPRYAVAAGAGEKVRVPEQAGGSGRRDSGALDRLALVRQALRHDHHPYSWGRTGVRVTERREPVHCRMTRNMQEA